STLYNEHLLCFSSLLRSHLGIDSSILRSSGSLLRSLLRYRRPRSPCACRSDVGPCLCSSDGRCSSRLRSPSCCCTCIRSPPGRCCSSRFRSPRSRSSRARTGSRSTSRNRTHCSPCRPRDGCPCYAPGLRCPNDGCPCLRCPHGCCCPGPCSHRTRPGRIRPCLRSFRLSRLFHRIEQGKEVGIRRIARLQIIDCLFVQIW
ncbi:hypothetical protein PENTCL1PPCAC_1721, partial [Pristionchus entomophagus]